MFESFVQESCDACQATQEDVSMDGDNEKDHEVCDAATGNLIRLFSRALHQGCRELSERLRVLCVALLQRGGVFGGLWVGCVAITPMCHGDCFDAYLPYACKYSHLYTHIYRYTC